MVDKLQFYPRLLIPTSLEVILRFVKFEHGPWGLRAQACSIKAEKLWLMTWACTPRYCSSDWFVVIHFYSFAIFLTSLVQFTVLIRGFCHDLVRQWICIVLYTPVVPVNRPLKHRCTCIREHNPAGPRRPEYFWAKTGNSLEKPPDHPQAELGLSHMWPKLGSNPQWWDDEWFRVLKISILNHSAMGAACSRIKITA